MPPKKAAAPAKKAPAKKTAAKKPTKGAIKKVVKKQAAAISKAKGKSPAKSPKGKSPAKAPVKTPAPPGKRGGTRAGAAAGRSGAASSAAASGGSAKKAPARTMSTGIKVAAGKTANLVKDTDIYVEGSTVWACDLSFIDRAKNSDKFYNMRVLQAQDSSAYWATQNWGRTGTSGQSNIDGPFPSVEHAKAVFVDGFERKTGNTWGASFSRKANKYNYVKRDYGVARDTKTSWEYHLTSDPLGKPDGWYPYDGSVTDEGTAMANMEEYWEQYQGNSWLDTRFVDSGTYTYKVAFKDMTQTNTKSNKTRPIRRV